MYYYFCMTFMEHNIIIIYLRQLTGKLDFKISTCINKFKIK